jgi:hypothetical protein
MTTAPGKRLATVWFLLSAITIASWWIGSRHGHAFTLNAVITFSVMAIAAVKVRLIIREFMEARHAPSRLRRITDAWIAFLFVTLLAVYVIGTALHH